MAYTNWLNLDPGGYNVFALTKEVITNIGYFDENFFPVSFSFFTIFIISLFHYIFSLFLEGIL